MLGDGCQSIFFKLTDRNNYLNRPHKRAASPSSSECPVKNKKRLLSKKAGCRNWAPEIPINNNNNEDQVNKAKNIDVGNEDFERLLDETYPQQHKFLNCSDNPLLVKDIKEEWPVLFSPRAIKYHFKKLTNADINILDTQFNEKGTKIIQHAMKKMPADDDTLTEVQPLEKRILFAIAKHFGEDLNQIIFECPVSSKNYITKSI